MRTRARQKVAAAAVVGLALVTIAPGFKSVQASPPASACTVDNAGLNPGGQRMCSFTATTMGGATMRSDGVVMAAGNGAQGYVTITRQGIRRTHTVQYNSARAGELGVFSCGGLIEPGDLVEVVLTNGPAALDGSTVTLGAGEGWYCWQ